MRYLVEVEWATHDDLHAGTTAAGRHRVWVEAERWTEARLVASQMVAARTGAMPTRAEYLE